VSDARVLASGEGLTLAPAPEVSFTLKTGSDETNGVWTLFEYTVPPRFAGPPPHWHKTTDEGFFILDGTVRFEVNGETTDVEAGGYARVPPGVVHRFSNPTDEPARFLGIAIPGGFERYFVELGELMASEPSWPPADMGPLLALMARHDTFPPPAP
jgi:mannose-6-phosphate isomerase-like protein (cupin superfamily)